MEERFKSACPQLYEGFCQGVPIADMTAPNGIQNLAGHCVANYIVPDLGKPSSSHTAAKPDAYARQVRSCMQLLRLDRALPPLSYIWISPTL